ncbi:GNAT family N-acetyltransferase [Mycolicibacterium moriokaense]|nr:GNAT family N-acetyltransferase [Mycolicibacterium moriokaense]ORB25788.1 GNAT family N-acetyltransferase [Mycolicibacterium moriokaense]
MADDLKVDKWTATPATAQDHPLIADFLATTPGLGGRKFAADSRDIAEQFDGAFPGAAAVVRDTTGRIRGYAVLHQPHGVQPEILADFVFDSNVPPDLVDGIVGDVVARYAEENPLIPDSFLRTIIGTDQQSAISALTRRGAYQEAEFIRARKPLHDEDPDALEAAAIDGITVVGWPEIVERDLGEQVRQLQFDTFLEHFGNMSKTPELWAHHIQSRAFAPDFSVAAIDDHGDVIGYVLGSTYTAGTGVAEERSAHTDYIGVRRDRRRLGIGELLLRKIWLAALRRGLGAASLGTDINNKSKAHLLYQRLGYVAVENSSAYRIDAAQTR